MPSSDTDLNERFMLFQFCYIKTMLVSGLYSIDDRISSEFETAGGIEIGKGNQIAQR